MLFWEVLPTGGISLSSSSFPSEFSSTSWLSISSWTDCLAFSFQLSAASLFALCTCRLHYIDNGYGHCTELCSPFAESTSPSHHTHIQHPIAQSWHPLQLRYAALCSWSPPSGFVIRCYHVQWHASCLSDIFFLQHIHHLFTLKEKSRDCPPPNQLGWKCRQHVGNMSATRQNVANFCPDRPILATWFTVCRHTLCHYFPTLPYQVQTTYVRR